MQNMDCAEKEKLDEVKKEVHDLWKKMSGREWRDKTLAWVVWVVVAFLWAILLLFYNSIDDVRKTVEQIQINGVSSDIENDIKDIQKDISLLKGEKLDKEEFREFQKTFKQEIKENITSSVKLSINDELEDFEKKILNIITVNQEKQNTEYHGIISTLWKINKKLDEK